MIFFSEVILLSISSPSSASELVLPFFIPITGTSSDLENTRFDLIFRPKGGYIYIC